MFGKKKKRKERNAFLSQVQWHVLVIPATHEGEAGSQVRGQTQQLSETVTNRNYKKG